MTTDNDFPLDEQAEAADTDHLEQNLDDDPDRDQADLHDADEDDRHGAGDDSRRTGARGANVKQIAKRSIEKYLEVNAATESDRRAAALVLGTPSRTDAADITIAVVAAQRANLRLLDRTDAIADADDPFDAMAVVMALEPADIRRTWDLLHELDALSDRWPGGAATAAKTIARAVHADSGAVLAGTARIRALLRK